jgi:hypothetical protein
VSIINFTVQYDQFASQSDGTDGGVDSDLIALIGSVTFTPVFADEKPVLAPTYDPRPAGFKLLPIIGYVDSDARLKSRPGGDVGVRLPANDPVFELESLTYKVEFNLRTPLGKPVTVEGGYLVAPDEDVTLNLADVLEPTGAASVQVLGQQLVYAHEIVDSTDIGVDLMTAASSAVVQAAAAPNPTAVKTAAYTASAGELVPADAASGGFTVTLPAAPAAGTTIWIKKIDTTTNAVIVQRSGSTDVFNKANGPSLLHLAVPGESVQVQYRSGIWYVVAHSFAVPGLDGRYVRQGPGSSSAYYLLDKTGSRSLGIDSVINSVNYLETRNSTTGNPVLLYAASIEANASIQIRPKGTGIFSVNSGPGNEIIMFVPIAGAVNSWRFDNSTATNALTCRANGNDPSVSFNFVPKGSGTFQVNSAAVLLTGGALGTPSSGTLTNCTFPTLNQNTTGTAAGLSSTLAVGSGGTGATTLTGLVKGNGTSAMSAAVAGTDYVEPGGAAGTPSSLTLTNATGLPVSGITASTSAALGVGSLEIGHASDTSLTRSAAGVLAVEGVDLVNVSSAQTLTGKTYVSGSTSTATAAGITTLTSTSAQVQIFTGSTTQTVRMPSAGITAGMTMTIINNSSGNLTIQSSAGVGFQTIPQYGIWNFVARVDTPTDWSITGISFTPSSAGGFAPVRDLNGFLFSTGFAPTLTSTATAGTTTTLNSQSSEVQRFTGTTTHTCVLPTTSIAAGRRYTIINSSTDSVTVNASGGATVTTLTTGTSATLTALQATPTTAAHWHAK